MKRLFKDDENNYILIEGISYDDFIDIYTELNYKYNDLDRDFTNFYKDLQSTININDTNNIVTIEIMKLYKD